MGCRGKTECVAYSFASACLMSRPSSTALINFSVGSINGGNSVVTVAGNLCNRLSLSWWTTESVRQISGFVCGILNFTFWGAVRFSSISFTFSAGSFSVVNLCTSDPMLSFIAGRSRASFPEKQEQHSAVEDQCVSGNALVSLSLPVASDRAPVVMVVCRNLVSGHRPLTDPWLIQVCLTHCLH